MNKTQTPLAGIDGHGYCFCKLCNERVVSFNLKRHTESKKHKENEMANKNTQKISFDDNENVKTK